MRQLRTFFRQASRAPVCFLALVLAALTSPHYLSAAPRQPFVEAQDVTFVSTDASAASSPYATTAEAAPSIAGNRSAPQVTESHERDGFGHASFEGRGAFVLGQNDLKLTTHQFPQFSLGAQGQFRLHGVHQIRPVAEWWYFPQGHQVSAGPQLSQSLDTRVRALALGGEYLYRLGHGGRLSVGGELYLMRWSVHSVNTITDGTLGSATSSGTSHWYHPGVGPGAAYRLSQRLELQGRWVYSHYGYEHIAISSFLIGAAWRL